MNKYLLILLLAFLVLPFTVSAAYNDVHLDGDTDISLTAIPTTIVASEGGNVETITVNTGNIVITGAYVDSSNHSIITLVSSEKRELTNTWSLSTTCGTSSSSLTITWTASSAASITVTPSSGTCNPGGGGGGGGGGGSYIPPAPTMPTTTTGSVTATASAGGETTLTTTAGSQVTVEIPANTVISDTTVTVTSAATSPGSPATGSFMVGNVVYNISATSGGQAVTTFSQAVSLTFTYTDSQVAGFDENSLKVYRWNGTQWVALTSSVNTVTNTITATTTQFSYFSIIGEHGTTTTTTTKPLSGMTIAELQAEVARISALIAQLQTQLLQMQGVTSGKFATDLYYGIKGNAGVKRLQQFLIDNGYLTVAATGNYLAKTVVAVKLYQKAKGITPVNGRFGPKTRAAANADLGF